MRDRAPSGTVTARERERRALVARPPDGRIDPRRWLADLTELTDLLLRLTGAPRHRTIAELLPTALAADPVELDRRLGRLHVDDQDAFAELVGSFPRVAQQLPNLRRLANQLHAARCPCYEAATVRHVERLRLLRSARRNPAPSLTDDALAAMEERAIRF